MWHKNFDEEESAYPLQCEAEARDKLCGKTEWQDAHGDDEVI